MKKSIFLSILTFFACFSTTMSLFAQNKASAINIGYPGYVAFDSPNLGVHVGLHHLRKLNKNFSIEGRIAGNYGKFNRDSNTFSHDGGDITTASANLGIRWWFVGNEDAKVRPSISVLPLSVAYFRDAEYNANNQLYVDENKLAYLPSAMLNVQLGKHLNLGLELESLALGSLYVGYSF